MLVAVWSWNDNRPHTDNQQQLIGLESEQPTDTCQAGPSHSPTNTCQVQTEPTIM